MEDKDKEKRLSTETVNTKRRSIMVTAQYIEYEKIVASYDSTVVVESVEKQEEDLSADLFDTLEAMVEHCITDTFSRFSMSELYRTMVSDVQQYVDSLTKRDRKMSVMPKLTSDRSRLLVPPNANRGSRKFSPLSSPTIFVSSGSLDSKLNEK